MIFEYLLFDLVVVAGPLALSFIPGPTSADHFRCERCHQALRSTQKSQDLDEGARLVEALR